jgi:hypothetical protein
VRTETGADLGLACDAAGMLVGRAGAQMREWDRLRAGEQLWYRLKPGVHALAAHKTQLFRGGLTFARGGAEVALRPALLRKGGRFELYRPTVPADPHELADTKETAAE